MILIYCLGGHDLLEKDFYKYVAFISYNHNNRDKKWARWIQKELESYRIPTKIRKEHNILAKRIGLLFRDETDLGVSELTEALAEAVRNSRYIIVVCSPEAVSSTWVYKEVRLFMLTHAGKREYSFEDLKELVERPLDYSSLENVSYWNDHIIPFIIEGKCDSDGDDNCYVPELKAFNPKGAEIFDEYSLHITGKSKTKAKCSIIAKILKLEYNEIRRREDDRKRKLRTLISVSILFITLILAFLAMYFIPYTKHYDGVVFKYCAPYGIGELTADEMTSRESHVDITYRFFRPISFSNVNCFCNPANSENYTNLGYSVPVRAEYEYDSYNPLKIKSSRISAEIQYDLYGGVKDRLLYTFNGDKVSIIYQAANDEDLSLSARGSSSIGSNYYNSFYGESNINRELLTLDENGGVVKRVFFSGNNPSSDQNGFYGFEYELDSLGRNSKGFPLDAHAQRFSTGLNSIVIKYRDDSLLPVSIFYLDAEGALYSVDTIGCASMDFEYDANGNCLRITSKDSEGEPIISNFLKSAIIEYEPMQVFDNGTYSYSISYLDSNGEPFMLPVDGFSKAVIIRDYLGRQIDVRYYGVDGNPVRIMEGGIKISSRKKTEYESFSNGGYSVRYYYYEGDCPVEIDKGYHSVKIYFDENNIQQKAEYFSKDGEYADIVGSYNPEYSYSKITYEYSYGMVSKEYHLDDTDNLVYITVYESSNHTTENFDNIYFTDPDGNLILSPDYGVARIETSYDETGRIIRFICYDERDIIIDSDAIGRSFEVIYNDEGSADISYFLDHEGITEIENGIFAQRTAEDGLNMITFVDGFGNILANYPVIVYFRTREEDRFALYVMYFMDSTMTEFYPMGDSNISCYAILKSGKIPEFSWFFDAYGQLMIDGKGNFISGFSSDEEFEIIALNDGFSSVMDNVYDVAGQIKEKRI